MPTLAFVGLDVSQPGASVCFLLADGSEPLPAGRSPIPSLARRPWRPRWRSWPRPHQIDQLRIGMEATGLLWWHLACTLKDAPALAPFARRIDALNPHLITTFRANYGALPKSDHADAFLIAERIRFGRLLPWPFQLDARYAPLQRLTRFRCHLAQK